jgi:hypothetical protein
VKSGDCREKWNAFGTLLSSPIRLVSRHIYAIVDEVDSILIDEARTPLIISGPLDDRSEFYNTIDAYIPKLEKADYEVDEKQRASASIASCAPRPGRNPYENPRKSSS